MPAHDATRGRLVAAALALAVVGALLALLPAPAPGAVPGTSVAVAGGDHEAVTARRAGPRPPLPALLVVAAFPLVLSLVLHRRAVRVSRPGQRPHADVWIPERAPPAAS